jgi:hypothetical protein
MALNLSAFTALTELLCLQVIETEQFNDRSTRYSAIKVEPANLPLQPWGAGVSHRADPTVLRDRGRGAFVQAGALLAETHGTAAQLLCGLSPPTFSAQGRQENCSHGLHKAVKQAYLMQGHVGSREEKEKKSEAGARMRQ